MSALADKIRKSREFLIEVEGWRFVVRRPTDLEAMELRGKPLRDLLRFIVGWEGVREIDLIPGGDPHPLAFDHDACAAWFEDRLDLFGALAEKIQAAYADHAKAREDQRKN